jgi:TolB-like protein
MGGVPSASRLMRFGAFELDVRSGELRKQGTLIKLQEQPLRILEMLLAKRGEVVTREELRSILWPNNTFVDFDHGLNKAINKLREALGDSAESPRFVETLSRRGYRFIGDMHTADATGDSIVVLPLVNMSADPENEYFADGITEEIINALAQIRDLHVVARSSAFSFKGKHIDPRVVGEQLNVRTVLEGSVRRAGNQLRITAQLVNAADGFHLWSERYDREMKDVFEIQDDIARGIVERLKMTLEGGGERPLIKAGTQNLEAYQLYLKGRVLLPRRGPTAQYLDCFARAVQLDPDYAQAWAGLADSHSVLGYTGIVPPGPAMAKALDAARRAVALDGSLAEAHNALAIASLMGAWDNATAEREFRRALTSNPRYIQARVWYALFYLMYSEGRMNEAMAEAKLALESDPLSGYAHLMYALICAYAGEYPTAIKASRRSVELDPESYLARMILGEVLRVGGEFEESVANGELALAMSGRHAWAQASLAIAFADWGKPEHAEAIYAELLGRSRRQYVAPCALAVVALAASKDDEALQFARQAVEMRDPHCQFWFSRYGHVVDRLYTYPRFRELIALMGRDDWLRDQEPVSRQP